MAPVGHVSASADRGAPPTRAAAGRSPRVSRATQSYSSTAQRQDPTDPRPATQRDISVTFRKREGANPSQACQAAKDLWQAAREITDRCRPIG